MGGAALTGAVHRLVLYEPGLGISDAPGSIEEIETAVAAGDLETAALLVLDGITASTLLLSGSETPADLRAATDRAAAAIAGARVQVLAGHAHLAHRTDPALVAAAIRRFVLG